ncbi:MFS transporter [Sorangium sp. So ce1128]
MKQRLLAATLLTNVADGMHTLALGKFLFDRTGAVSSFAFVLGFDYLLGVLSQIYAGPIVDRLNPRLVATAAGINRALIMVALAALALYPGREATIAVVALSALLKAGSHFYKTAAFALVPGVVAPEEQGRYASLAMLLLQLGQLLGVGAVGVLLSRLSYSVVFLIDAGLFLATSLILWRLSASDDTRDTAGRAAFVSLSQVIEDWKELAHGMRRAPSLLVHVAISTGDLAVMACLNLLLVPLVNSRFGGDTVWLSVLDGAFASGVVITFLLARKRQDPRHLVAFQLLQVLFLAVIAVASSRAAITASFLGLGAAIGFTNALLTSKLYQRMPPEQKGRVSSFRFLLVSIVTVIGIGGTTRLLSWSAPWGVGFVAGMATLFCIITVTLGRQAFSERTS